MKLKDDFENNLYTLLNIIIVITVDNLSPIISLFWYSSWELFDSE